jgi:hypothetical protein
MNFNYWHESAWNEIVNFTLPLFIAYLKAMEVSHLKMTLNQTLTFYKKMISIHK